MNKRINNKIVEDIDNQSLLQLLHAKENDYEENVYELYRNEAVKRGISLENIEIETLKEKSEEKDKTLESEIKLGYFFAFLGGIVGFVIAVHLRMGSRNDPENTLYREKQSTIISTISFAMLIFGIPFISHLISIIAGMK